VAAIPSYKAHRLTADGRTEDTPEGLEPQVPVLVDVLAALGVARVGCPGFEADDVIASLAERAAGAGTPVDVVTGDRDLFQLVDDARSVRVLYTAARGVKDIHVVDQAELARKYGVPDGRAYAAMAALRGDPSDGLPGVPGIGEKTAAALLARYGDLAGLRRAVDDGDRSIRGAQRARLEAARGYLDVAPSVVDVVRDVPLGKIADVIPGEPADLHRLAELAARWGLASSVTRVTAALAKAAPG
jgi:5'-3' exonuclease